MNGAHFQSQGRRGNERDQKENERPKPRLADTNIRRTQQRHPRLSTRMYHREPFPQPPSVVDISDVSAELPPPRASVSSPSNRPSYLSTQAFWLALYFCFNLGLTLYNKGVLLRFPFPYTLTAIHALFGTIGGALLLHNGSFLPAKLDPQETIVIVAFSVLYSVNIVVSNLSLQLVTIPVRLLPPTLSCLLLNLFL